MGERLVELFGAPDGSLGDERHDCVDLGIHVLDLGEVRRQGFARREVLCADSAGHFARAEEADIWGRPGASHEFDDR